MLAKFLRHTVATAAVTLGVATQVVAAPTFQINPSVIGGPAGTYTADFINGNASTLLTLIPGVPGTTSGSGYIIFSSFALNNVPVVNTSPPGSSSGFNVFATYNFTTTLTSGTLGGLGSTYNVTSLQFNLYGDNLAVGPNATFTAATSSGASGTPAIVTLGNAQLLGAGSLAVTGVSDINAQGGTSFTTTELFNLTPFGSTFFTDPVPFFNLAFNSFTNTQPGVTRSSDGLHLAINNASGGVDFNRSVPEPATMALVGIALLGVAVSRRRKA